ncbi:MAG: hypothetical protein IPL32_07830 [Chloracidobacterium sp.]|nr:hypothetical protein [Chloracidobacterium sp.]
MFKKTFLFFSFMLLIAVSIKAQVYNDNFGGQGAVVYQEKNSRGRSQSFGPGRYLSGAGEFGDLENDEASSVTVRSGYRIRLCENEGNGRGSGKCEEYGPGSFNLKYNDKASFIEVRRKGGSWGGNNDPWGGNNDSWIYGTWNWRRGNDRRTMTINRNGTVTVYANGSTTRGSYSKGTLILGGSQATITRQGNELRVDIAGSNESYIWKR